MVTKPLSPETTTIGESPSATTATTATIAPSFVLLIKNARPRARPQHNRLSKVYTNDGDGDDDGVAFSR